MPLWLGILALAGVFLTGQVVWYEPPPPEEVTISLLVQVDPQHPIEVDGMVVAIRFRIQRFKSPKAVKS
jgi:hypothetical protein